MFCRYTYLPIAASCMFQDPLLVAIFFFPRTKYKNNRQPYCVHPEVRTSSPMQTSKTCTNTLEDQTASRNTSHQTATIFAIDFRVYQKNPKNKSHPRFLWNFWSDFELLSSKVLKENSTSGCAQVLQWKHQKTHTNTSGDLTASRNTSHLTAKLFSSDFRVYPKWSKEQIPPSLPLIFWSDFELLSSKVLTENSTDVCLKSILCGWQL